jgi:hypothetical protein
MLSQTVASVRHSLYGHSLVLKFDSAEPYQAQLSILRKQTLSAIDKARGDPRIQTVLFDIKAKVKLKFHKSSSYEWSANLLSSVQYRDRSNF